MARRCAADTGSKVWSKVESNIYTQCFTNVATSSENWCKICQSIDHGSDICPLRSPVATPAPVLPPEKPFEHPFSPPQKWSASHSLPQVCKHFNQFNGDCKFGDQRIFQHKCEICNKQGHPHSQCAEGKKGNL